MNRIEIRPHNGETRLAEPSAPYVRPGELARAPGEPPGDSLAHVVRDALDQATEIVRDAVSLGSLEAKRVASAVGPRVAWATAAFAFGFVGIVLLAIAVFIGLGVFIPSVGWRLFIFAIAFLVIAAIAVFEARPRKREPKQRFQVAAPESVPPAPRIGPPEPLPGHVARVTPVEGIGE